MHKGGLNIRNSTTDAELICFKALILLNHFIGLMQYVFNYWCVQNQDSTKVGGI